MTAIGRSETARLDKPAGGTRPSTIVGGVLKKVTAALGEMPALPISYDGQQDPTLQTRLEAFIYQARAYQQRNGAGQG